MNICIFKGNLTRDCETRFTASNMAVVKFGIAINERVKKSDQWEDQAHFFDVTAFGKRGEAFAQHHQKGVAALLTCKATLNQWQDKEGNKRSKVEFLLQDFEFVKSRPQGNGGGQRQQSPPPPRQQEPAGVPESPEDIPFTPDFPRDW